MSSHPAHTDSVATVLRRELAPTIERWMKRVEAVPALASVVLNPKDRTAHLPPMLDKLIIRLGLCEGVEHSRISGANAHGKLRFNQGYSVPMLVEESRLLQISIFDTLHRNQRTLDPNLMMLGVITIADECDAELKLSVEGFMQRAAGDRDASPRVKAHSIAGPGK